MSFIDKHVVDALRERGTEPLACYESALECACSAVPPPFGEAWYGSRYREFAAEPSWLAASLVANAEKEAEGSRKLWEMAARSGDPGIADEVRKHAIDESRHAQVYVAMCDLVFPGALEGELREHADSLSPRYRSNDSPSPLPSSRESFILDEIIQMNIGEIRTRIHQLLMRPVILAHCPYAEQGRLQRMLDALLKDETKHIQYTARLIERLGQLGYRDFVHQTFFTRMNEFSLITLSEVGEGHFIGR